MEGTAQPSSLFAPHAPIHAPAPTAATFPPCLPLSHSDDLVLLARSRYGSFEPNQEGASIDRETENGMTALISAAEEDPHAPGHTWVQNDEGWEILAAALLLDRRIHRPKVNMRFDLGLSKKAPSQACSWSVEQSEWSRRSPSQLILFHPPGGGNNGGKQLTFAYSGFISFDSAKDGECITTWRAQLAKRPR